MQKWSHDPIQSRGAAICHRLIVVTVAAALGTIPFCYPSAAAQRGDPWTSTERYEFEYHVDFSQLSVGDDNRLRLWIPYPADTSHQSVLSATIESPWPYTLARDRSGNRALYIEGQGVPERDLVMRFRIERGPSDGIPAADVRVETPLDPERYLYAERLVPLDGLIRQVAEQQGANAETNAEKIRAFYDYVVKNLNYNKDGTGWGRGDAVWACDNKRGNCTDFHSLFIGMARSQRIPARFVIGFPVPSDRDEGTIGGYHCWVQFYLPERGWVPSAELFMMMMVYAGLVAVFFELGVLVYIGIARRFGRT